MLLAKGRFPIAVLAFVHANNNYTHISFGIDTNNPNAVSDQEGLAAFKEIEPKDIPMYGLMEGVKIKVNFLNFVLVDKTEDNGKLTFTLTRQDMLPPVA